MAVLARRRKESAPRAQQSVTPRSSARGVGGRTAFCNDVTDVELTPAGVWFLKEGRSVIKNADHFANSVISKLLMAGAGS